MLTSLRRTIRPPIADDHGALAALTNDLESVFAALSNPVGQPPVFDWTAIAAPAPGVPAPGSQSRTLRLAGGVAAALAAIVLSAAGYAAVSGNNLADLMFRNFGETPGEQGIYTIGVRQTIDGITVTVDHAVFDGSPLKEPIGPNGRTAEYLPVMVQFTVSGLDDGVRYSVSESMMSGSLPLRRIGAVGLRGQSDILNRELPPGTEQMLIAYDTTGVAPESGSLALQLEVTVTPRGTVVYGQGDPANPGLVTPLDAPSGVPVRFTFGFFVPIK